MSATIMSAEGDSCKLIATPIVECETFAKFIKAVDKSSSSKLTTLEDTTTDSAAVTPQHNSSSEFHPVYCNDPRKLWDLLKRRITVCTKNKKLYKGWVQTMDPVSQSVLLVKFEDDGSTVAKITLVPGYNITRIRLHCDDPSPEIELTLDTMFRNKEEQYSSMEIIRRREVLRLWLKENRVPYILKEDDSLEVLQFASISPPYDCRSITCTNEVVLDKLLKLLRDCPHLDRGGSPVNTVR